MSVTWIYYFTYRIKTKKNCSTIVYIKFLKTLSNNHFVFCQKLNYLSFIPFLSPSRELFRYLPLSLFLSLPISFINSLILSRSHYLAVSISLSLWTMFKHFHDYKKKLISFKFISIISPLTKLLHRPITQQQLYYTGQSFQLRSKMWWHTNSTQ